MPTSQQFPPTRKFYPPRYSENKEAYVFYYVINPDSGQLVRKKIMLNRIEKKTLRRSIARQIISELTEKLNQGWNPFLESKAEKGFYPFSQAAKKYMEMVKKELRPDTERSYRSMVDIMLRWIEKVKKKPDLYCINFSRMMAIEIMEYVTEVRGVKERTYNGYLVAYKAMFNWMRRQRYISDNPFEGMKEKRPEKKKRILITLAQRMKIKEYLYTTDHPYYCMCLLAFHGLMRPQEITYIKIKHLNLKNQVVFVPGETSKNHNDRIATLPGYVCEELKKLQIDKPENYYLFSEHWQPGKVRIDRRKIGKQWEQVRKNCKLPMEVQFYSLRDSGIVQMLEDGISPKDVKEQADHSSLMITEAYLKHANPEGSPAIKQKSSAF